MLHDLESVPITREHLVKVSHFRNNRRVAGLAPSERPENDRATKHPESGCAQFLLLKYLFRPEFLCAPRHNFRCENGSVLIHGE